MSYLQNILFAIVVSKMHSNEAILLFFKQVKHDYSLLLAYAVICGRFNITVNRDYEG